MAEARRRVDAGENTSPPPPPAPTQPARARAPRVAKPATVDPATGTGSTLAVWRSVQHFCTSESVPDAMSTNLDRIVTWSGTLQPFRLRPRVVARLDRDGAWLPICYAKDGKREPITLAQADRYREARLSDETLSGGAQRPLKETDHPEASTSL